VTDVPLDPVTGRRPSPGRPTLLTDDLADRIVQVVQAGNYLKTAAQFAGVGQSTLLGWLARGRAAAALADTGQPVPAEEERYLTFLERVTQGETVAEVSAVTHWRRAFTDDWRAARDYLARKRPDQWAAKTTVTLSGEEAEARIERATLEALTALGVDAAGLDLSGLDPESDWDGEDVGEDPEP
jgi:transposase